MKLRLLVTKDCNRTCAGCCNKDWNLDKLPICQSYEGYDEIILTGGEPMLHPDKVLKIIEDIRTSRGYAWDKDGVKVYLQTAYVDNIGILRVGTKVDGVSVTLHEQVDVEPFIEFTHASFSFLPGRQSHRVNVFRGVQLDSTLYHSWRIKTDITWKKDCPIPADEVFMRVANL